MCVFCLFVCLFVWDGVEWKGKVIFVKVWLEVTDLVGCNGSAVVSSPDGFRRAG